MHHARLNRFLKVLVLSIAILIFSPNRSLGVEYGPTEEMVLADLSTLSRPLREPSIQLQLAYSDRERQRIENDIDAIGGMIKKGDYKKASQRLKDFDKKYPNLETAVLSGASERSLAEYRSIIEQKRNGATASLGVGTFALEGVVTKKSKPEGSGGFWNFEFKASDGIEYVFMCSATDSLYFKLDNTNISLDEGYDTFYNTYTNATLHIPQSEHDYVMNTCRNKGCENGICPSAILMHSSVRIIQSPTSGRPGTTFLQKGSGFTPNDLALIHVKKPDGTEFPTMKQQIDNSGHFEISYTSALDKQPGIYTWWAIDGSTGRKSNEVKFELTQPIRNLEISPSFYDFGTIGPNEHASQLFTLHNTGTGSLTESKIEMSDTEDFLLIFGTGSNPCARSPTLSPGQSCTFRATFSPVRIGNSFANLRIFSNDPDSILIEVPLRGRALAHGLGCVITIDGMERGASYYPFWPDMPTIYLYEAIPSEWKEAITKDVGRIVPFAWSRDLKDTRDVVPELYETIKSYNNTCNRIVIISHSWGTVLSFIALKKHDDIHVDKFITLGSPLNADYSPFRDTTWAWLDEFHISYVISKPDNISEWHNYYTSCDLLSGKLSHLSDNVNYENTTRYSNLAACHSSYFEDKKEWETILRDVIKK
jgi:hypothetical protein